MTTNISNVDSVSVSSNLYNNEYQNKVQEDQDIEPALEALLRGKYEIQKCIGKGAQGNVYKGRRLTDNSLVAIKQLRINSAKDWKQYELFEREAEVLKNLQVPGTAKFYEAIKSLDGANPTSVIVQEYIDGRSLQTYIDGTTHFGFDVICGILAQTINILRSLHQQNPPVIHRDVKPSNIILRFDNGKYSRMPEVFLIDFGAVANPQVQDGGSTVTGTYGYMAPEQLIGQPLPASDIYSFGVLAVYLLSGVPPEKIEVKDLQLLIEPHLEHLPFIVTSFLRQLIEPSPVQRLLDYDFIQSAFQSFGKSNFKISLPAVSDKTKNIVPAKKVKAIDQKGNVAQWQALPDQTPRKIPKPYKKIIDRDVRALKTLTPKDINISYFDFLTNSFSIKEYNKSSHPRSIYLIGFVFICGSVLYFVSYMIYNYLGLKEVVHSWYNFDENSRFLFEYGSGIDDMNKLVLTLILMCIVGGLYFVSRKFIKRAEIRSALKYIFVHGRKSLATISEIKPMIPVLKPYFWDEESVMNCVYSGTLRSWRKEQAGENVKVRPLWRIEYYFNPPDDDSREPVHHLYYSEVPPVNLQIGETIPILYFINMGTVYSLPYPLPFTDSLMQCPNCVSACGINIELSESIDEYGSCIIELSQDDDDIDEFESCI